MPHNYSILQGRSLFWVHVFHVMLSVSSLCPPHSLTPLTLALISTLRWAHWGSANLEAPSDDGRLAAIKTFQDGALPHAAPHTAYLKCKFNLFHRGNRYLNEFSLPVYHFFLKNNSQLKSSKSSHYFLGERWVQIEKICSLMVWSYES